MNNLEQIKNYRNKLLKYRALSCALVLSAALPCSGCKERDKIEFPDISNSSTIAATLESINTTTTMDEIFAVDCFVDNRNDNSYAFDELLKLYEDARKEENLIKCNNILYKIGKMIMKAQLSETLNIDVERITNLDIDLVKNTNSDSNMLDKIVTISYKANDKETVSGGIELNKEEEITNTYLLENELADLAINTWNAYNCFLNFDAVDAVYKSYIEHLLTSATISKPYMFDSREVISADIDPEKVTMFNANGKGRVLSN